MRVDDLEGVIAHIEKAQHDSTFALERFTQAIEESGEESIHPNTSARYIADTGEVFTEINKALTSLVLTVAVLADQAGQGHLVRGGPQELDLGD